MAIPSKTSLGPADEHERIDRPWLLRGGILIAALLIALVAWRMESGEDEGPSEPPPSAETRILSDDELVEAAADLHQAVYWAGPLEGTELALRTLGVGSGVEVLYLPEGTSFEDGEEPPADSLTVGSYPLPDPRKSLEGFAKRAGSTKITAKDGQELVTSSEAPTSVYLVPPGNEVQVEVYAPTARRALFLASSGQIERIP